MFNIFRNKKKKLKQKLKEDVFILEYKLVHLLANKFPNILKTYSNRELHSVIVNNSEREDYNLTLVHIILDPNLPKLTSENQDQYFDIKDLRIKWKSSGEYLYFDIRVFDNVIGQIDLQFVDNLSDDYDFDEIRIEEIKTKFLEINGGVKNEVIQIIGNLENSQINKLELDYSFEIELGDDIFYTIIDMEDGNYIAINKNSKVYRLYHDHIEQSLKIADSVSELLEFYNGDKSTLEKYFD